LPASINRLMEAVALSCPPPLIDLKKNKKQLASPIELTTRPNRARCRHVRAGSSRASSLLDLGAASLLSAGFGRSRPPHRGIWVLLARSGHGPTQPPCERKGQNRRRGGERHKGGSHRHGRKREAQQADLDLDLANLRLDLADLRLRLRLPATTGTAAGPPPPPPRYTPLHTPPPA
jgi:hypothetical protein